MARTKRTSRKSAVALDVALITALIREHRTMGTDDIATALELDQDGEDELAAFMIEHEGATTWLRGGDDRWYVQAGNGPQTTIPGTEREINRVCEGPAQAVSDALIAKAQAEADLKAARINLEEAMRDQKLSKYHWTDSAGTERRSTLTETTRLTVATLTADDSE